MIKYGINQLIEPISKIFNMIFKTGHFPKIWNESYIWLIHKKRDKSNPANYRGISLTSNLGKLFNKILLARIMRFINDNQLIHKIKLDLKKNQEQQTIFLH